ncbi:DUF1707 domain-containing protein [Enemella sp. A6]|uniref:DUF1707 domain-containing protein n=1 Tax=Enemella sp. A6 TaxID=3440152 RepID=UPI003EBA5FD6
MMTMGRNNEQMLITEEQRERAESWLQDAYADGRLDALEFDQRMGIALQARTRGELNRAFHGLTAPARPHGRVLATRRPTNAPAPGHADLLAAAGHLSPLMSSFIGPIITMAIAKPGSYARRQSAEALNFQLLSLLALIAAGIIGWEILITVVTIGWLVFTIYGGIKALQGAEFRNPVLALTRFRPVKP